MYRNCRVLFLINLCQCHTFWIIKCILVKCIKLNWTDIKGIKTDVLVIVVWCRYSAAEWLGACSVLQRSRWKNGCTVHAALVCIGGQRLGKNCSGHCRLLRSNFSDSDSGARVCVRHSDYRTVQFLSRIEWYLWTSVSVFCYIFRLY